MSFAYTVTKRTVFGDRRVAYGTYTSASSGTGGDVVTGLSTVEVFQLTPKGSAVATNAPVVNETLPLTNNQGTVTIVTDADQLGNWLAIGL